MASGITAITFLSEGESAQSASDMQGAAPGIPSSSGSMDEGDNEPNRFTFRLHFPDGGGPTLMCSGYDGMLVSVLRHRVRTFLEAPHPVHLLVGLSWEYDVLEHNGAITDRFFPGTHIHCPFLQQGSNVNVYFVRGEDVDVTRFELLAEPGSNEGSANEQSTSLSEGSSSGTSRSNGIKNGEREGDDNLDEMIRAQLAEDALRSSSSSAIDPPSRVRKAEALSDREYSARKARQEGLFEGYRRIKRIRSCRSRDPVQEAISARPVVSSGVFAGSTSTVEDLRREIREIRGRMRTQWNELNSQLQAEVTELKRVDPSTQDVCLVSDSEEEDDEADPDPIMIGDPPSDLPPGSLDPPDEGDSSFGMMSHAGLQGNLQDDFVGTPFLDGELGWCAVTAVGKYHGTPVVSYEPLAPPPTPVYRLLAGLPVVSYRRDYFSSESDVLSWCRSAVIMSSCDLYNWTVRLYGPGRVPFTPHELVHGKDTLPSVPISKKEDASDPRTCPPVSGRNRPLRKVLLSPRQVRRVMAARETLFKFGTFVPRNDREANASPEAARWKAGRDLEWLRLNEQGTFELDWDAARVHLEHPEYKKSDIGHCFYVYDYKFSGEHRVRLVFDGSRQSADTYSETYAPTARQESVRLFHSISVTESYSIGQYDVPQAFLKAFMDHVIFAYPPKGQASFEGQLLKVKRALYGGKQSAYLWFQMINEFLLELGFEASPLDQCFYKRKDAVLILFCDDLRIGAPPDVLLAFHCALFEKFGVTTASGSRFLGMDTHYDLEKGMLKISMETYIDMTVERFEGFDLSAGVPFRELVGCLLWVTLCVMGPELLRVKDLARRCNSYTPEDYKQALKVLRRVSDRKQHGLVFFRDSAGKEIIPSSSRSPLVCDAPISDDLGLSIHESQNELGHKLLCKASVLADDLAESPYVVSDPDSLDLVRVRLPVNSRYSLTVYGDASFAVGDLKQSVSGFVIFLNGTPLLWGSLKQTIVVDSSCSAEFVAASIAIKQLLHAENMIGFLGFTCCKPYRMFTDSMACLHIATNPARLGNVRHLQIRYHLVRCYVTLGDVEMQFCITEEMVADLFTKLVGGAQDERLTVRFYCLIPGAEAFVLTNCFKHPVG
jgi:hypothetical protein